MSNQSGSEQSSQPQGSKWEDLAKLLTALGPLVGTGMLYMIGWIYISNWYGYFGINTSQLNISLPQVLVRSIFPLIITLATIGVGVFLYYALSRISSFVLQNQLWVIFSFSLLFNLSISFYLFPSQLIIRIIFITLGIIGAGVILYYLLNWEWIGKIGYFMLRHLRWFTLGGSLLLILMLLLYFPKGLAIGGIAAASVIVVLFLFPDITLYLELLVSSIAKVFDFRSLLQNFTNINLKIRMGIFSFLYLFAVLLLSTSLAFQTAVQGKFGIMETNSVQRVFLVGPRLLNFMPDSEKYCDTKESCIYGPFGLIAENDNSYFLIKWDTNTLQQTTLFSRNAALYIIPRSNQNSSYSIVPESISIPSPTPTPTNTSLPTSTMTLTPQTISTATFMPQPTITLTLTPTP